VARDLKQTLKMLIYVLYVIFKYTIMKNCCGKKERLDILIMFWHLITGQKDGNG
jgi:hypothetical protein